MQVASGRKLFANEQRGVRAFTYCVSADLAISHGVPWLGLLARLVSQLSSKSRLRRLSVVQLYR